MKNLLPLSLVAAFAALLVGARADETTSTIKFSDPGKPGTVKVALAHGDIHIESADTSEVSVKSESAPRHETARKDGLRVLTESSSFSLVEKGNVVTLDAVSDGWIGAPSNFRLTVPRNSNVIISNAFGGNVTCVGVSGDIEIKSLNGRVRLEDIVGGALVETTNGEITATIRELHDNKPVSFTSMNGAVALRVPVSAKADIRLRTQNGSILTDFDEKTLVTKVEALPRSSRRGSGHTILTPEAREAFREAARAGAEAAQRAAEAIKEAAEAAREGAEAATDDQRAAGMREHGGAPVPPIPPIPPVPAIPAMTGGKLVTGTLNGGGPEISVTTMNGDVTLRQLEAK